MKKLIKISNKQEKGITLIALVITIIVLLILAGVTISALIENDGILNKATIANEETKQAEAFEEIKLKVAEVQIEKQGKATLKDVVEAFKIDTEYEYVVSLEEIATIKGDIPDVSDVNEIYVLHKNYQFKIENNLRVTQIGLVESDKPSDDKNDSYTNDGEWTATIPEDNWFAKEEYYDTTWDGEGTQENPYLITTEEELAGLSYQVASGETFDNSTYFQLTTDLYMGAHVWIPIGGKDISKQEENYYQSSTTNLFLGNFDGKGYTIAGLYYNNKKNNYGNYVGLFGYVASKSSTKITVQNIGVEDSYFSGYQNVGGIFGYINECQVIKCYNTATIEGIGYVGGITGYGFYSSIHKSYNKGNIASNGRASGYFGGLTGGGYVSCYSSYNKGKIEIKESENVNVGGISGYTINSNVTYNSYNAGDIYIQTDGEQSVAGGIYGLVNKGICENCYNIGKIEIKQGYKGGLIGKFGETLNGILSLDYCYFKSSTTDAIGYNGNPSNVTINKVGQFDDIEGTTFSYENSDAEEVEYAGDLLTKLNKWVDKKTNKTNYLSWRMDEELKHPVFVYED